MKIMLIMTGGTISSRMIGDTISPDTETAAPMLVEKYRERTADYETEFEVDQALNVLTENMTFTKLGKLLDVFRGLISEETLPYDGVIVAHGTDTLAYSSSLLALLLTGFSLPVMIVSSNYTLDRPEANGLANFTAAAELIKKGFGKGVYVPYRNSDGITYLHRGARLEQCRNYTSDFFSRGMTPYDRAVPYETFVDYPPLSALEKLECCVMKVEPYVGLDYSMIEPDDGIRAVLHGSYHSATACVERSEPDEPYTKYSALTLLDKCRAKDIDFWLGGMPAGFDPYKGSYSTTADLCKSGAKPVWALTSECAYMKLSIAYSLGFRGADIETFLARDLAGELIDDDN